jgi:NADH-quinone oxidoreductase subunit J
MTFASLVPYLVFGVLALVAVACAAAMIISRDAVYSALFLVLNFATVGVIYLTLGAPFIALSQIAVYAGAIMVLFLFVIMLLGGERFKPGPARRSHLVFAGVLGLVFLVELGLGLAIRYGNNTVPAVQGPGYASPTTLGVELFSKYALPFELTSLILLAALIGAIVLTREGKKDILSGVAPDETTSKESKP